MTAITPLPAAADRSRRPVRDYLGLGLALAALLGMAVWSWGWLVEIQVDFGREIYLAWQLANGKSLYTDLVYYYGPLSPYLNALAFDVFGTSIRTLMLCNLAIAGLITVVLYLLLLDAGDAFSATVACVVFALVFPCGNWHDSLSIFNYLCPYCHPATHGLLLGLVSVLLAGRVTRSPTPWAAALCGLAMGLTFLTKPEPFISAGLAVLIGFVVTAWQRRLTRWRALAVLAAWSGGAGLVVLAAFTALSVRMDWQTALFGVLGSWPYVGNQGDTVFQRGVMGLDNVRGTLGALLWVLAWYGAMLLPLVVYAPARRSRTVLFVLGGGCLAMVIALGLPGVVDGLRPLPVLLAALAIGFGSWLVRSRDATGAQTTTRRLMFTVFAGLLLARIVLQVSVVSYGFVLAAPATLIVIVAFLAWLPAWVGAPANRLVHTGTILIAIAICVLLSLMRFRAAYEERSYVVGDGADAFLGNPRCQFAAPALEEIRRRVCPGETLCVLPEGILINYLSRVESSVPYDCFIPPALQMFGEQQIITSFQTHPPHYVLLFHRDSSEYGAPLFGRDYGRELYAWVRERYYPIAEYGRNPMMEGGDGLILMAPRSERAVRRARSQVHGVDR